MNNRKSLTKSLHTVTAVSRLALEMVRVRTDANLGMPSAAYLIRDALTVLGQPSDYPASDPTMAACLAAFAKLRA